MRYRANPVIVHAEKIVAVGEVLPNGSLEVTLDVPEPALSKDLTKFMCDPGMIARMLPRPGDYLVKQEDGYIYLNPKEVFERKYSPDELNALELGAAVRRAGMAGQ